MIKPHPDSAQVKIPPPLVLLFVFVLTVIMKFIFPSPFLSRTVHWLLGIFFFVLGAVLVFWSIRIFNKHKTGIAPWSPTLVIFREGPYMVSRNPIYLGGLCAAFGVMCLANNLYSLVLLVPLFLFLRNVIQKEEAYLTKKFGDEYKAYLKLSRRWV